ncbi:MAG: ATP-NAD kinase family protein [Pseudomonadales bacterium]|nr:ATP-NAD kinase family protein [Pseudomonadales bacterium]
MFRLGLIVNPVAGIGGSVGLKGSDGTDIQQQALTLGGTYKSNDRAAAALELLKPYAADIDWFVCPGRMGQSVVESSGFKPNVIELAINGPTTGEDTRNAVLKMNALNLDLLLFVGGDGTARDICSVVRTEQTALGIPAGVKMHSGVFAVTPETAGVLIGKFIRRERIGVTRAEVRDIDEDARRAGSIASRYYGELWVPELGNAVQQVKCCGLENEELDQQEIAAGFIETMGDDVGYLICPGSTTAELMMQLTHNNTLLGVDYFCGADMAINDLSEKQILDVLKDAGQNQQTLKIVVSPIGGQGYLFGRGNQQISSDVIKEVGKDNIIVMATPAKLDALEGRPLRVDTGSQQMDELLSGYIRVNTGFESSVLYPVGNTQ